jgi:hypothetical protein
LLPLELTLQPERTLSAKFYTALPLHGRKLRGGIASPNNRIDEKISTLQSALG